MTETEAQRRVRAKGMCGELLNEGRDICILASGHGNHDRVSYTAAVVREAAHVLVGVWEQQGKRHEDYDLIWRAKEYLHDAADKLP